MEDLRNVLMVCVLNVLKLWPWSHCPYQFPCTGRVRRYLPDVRNPMIWMLNFFLSPHLTTFDFWALGGPCKFHCTSMDCVTPSWRVSSSPESLVLVSPSVNLHWKSFLDLFFDMALCFPIASERNLLKWLHENIDKLTMLNKRRRWSNSLWLACQQVGFWCQHIWFGSLVLNWFCRTTNQAQICGF